MKLKQACGTVLIENTTLRPDLVAEHGFALWLDTGEAKVLFDTGASGAVCPNAEKLGIDLSEADAIVLSHGHSDHTGGLAAVADIARDAVVYAHPAAGLAVDDTRWLRSRVPEVVAPGVRTTGEIPRTTPFEEKSDHPRQHPDDQALYFEVDEGLVVIAGCAHAGAVNTLKYVARLEGTDRVFALLGGLHMGSVPEERMTQTITAFREFGLSHIGPCHCTGDAFVKRVRQELPAAWVSYQTGTATTFGATND